MSTFSQDDEEWLDVADTEMTGSSETLRSEDSIRSAPKITSHTSTALESPVTKEGILNGGLSISIKPKAAPVGTLPPYVSMRENAYKLLKSGPPIFHADLGGNYHILRDEFNHQIPPEHRQEFNCSAGHAS
jgi:hypothetical protein